MPNERFLQNTSIIKMFALVYFLNNIPRFKFSTFINNQNACNISNVCFYSNKFNLCKMIYQKFMISG